MVRISSVTVAAAAILGSALTLPTTVVDAHGFMANPAPTFKDPDNKTSPSGSMNGPAGPYKGNDEIRALAEKAGSKCGKTDPNGPVRAIPADGTVKFTITAQHIGPCELWLDDAKVASARECWSEYASKSIPVDFSKCKSGGCQLRWVWLATHNTPWEFYDNCVRVGGGGGGGNNTDPTPRPSSVKPKPTPVPSPTSTDKPQPTSTSKPSASPTPSPSGGDNRPVAPTASPSVAPDDDQPGDVKPNPDVQPSDGKCFRSKVKTTEMDTWCKDNCSMGFCPPDHCEKC